MHAIVRSIESELSDTPRICTGLGRLVLDVRQEDYFSAERINCARVKHLNKRAGRWKVPQYSPESQHGSIRAIDLLRNRIHQHRG